VQNNLEPSFSGVDVGANVATIIVVQDLPTIEPVNLLDYQRKAIAWAKLRDNLASGRMRITGTVKRHG
jgi:hypothetical protein